MSVIETITEQSLELREATTRYINITCKSRETGEPFDFEGFTVQTHLTFGTRRQYVPTAIVDSVVSYKIPAEASLGARSGIAETRIFKGEDVFEVYRFNITVRKADKPDTAPISTAPNE